MFLNHFSSTLAIAKEPQWHSGMNNTPCDRTMKQESRYHAGCEITVTKRRAILPATPLASDGQAQKRPSIKDNHVSRCFPSLHLNFLPKESLQITPLLRQMTPLHKALARRLCNVCV